MKFVLPLRNTFNMNETHENLLTGRNPIREALKAGRDIEKLLVAKGDLSGTARQIVAMAREARVPVQMVERSRLDSLAPNHQGLIAFASAYRYSETEDIFEEASKRGEDPFIIILDGVTDPHNLGAVIRTAAAVGAHGVIVPERRAAGQRKKRQVFFPYRICHIGPGHKDPFAQSPGQLVYDIIKDLYAKMRHPDFINIGKTESKGNIGRIKRLRNCVHFSSCVPGRL